MPPIAEPTVFPQAAGACAPCAVAVGNFDGVHLGHAASILRPEQAPLPLTTPARRAELLQSLGVDAVFVQPANAALMALEAEAFYDGFLRGRFAARAVVEGQDFRFGARRRGDVPMLAALCRNDGVELEVVPPVVVNGELVSSSRIRALVAAGDLAAARRLMASPYRLTGEVVVGARRGATIGFPTANLSGIATLLPALGVYAAVARVDGAAIPAAVHVGPNVTFGETSVSVEAHLIGFAGDLYGRVLDVDFLDRVRDTRRFASVDDLKARLADDVAAAGRIVAAASSPGTT